MPKKPRRKLTEADQTELFEEIDGKAVLPAAEDEEPQEKKGKAKKAQPEPEEDIGKGTGFLFDMLEESRNILLRQKSLPPRVKRN